MRTGTGITRRRREPRLLGINVEKPAVGEDLGAADIEGLSLYGVVFQAALEIVEHVGDGDGLHRVVDPAGGQHDGEAVHQVAHDLKRGAPRPQDHGGPQEGGGHRPGLENSGYLVAGAQVLAEMWVVGTAQAAQINDPVKLGRARGPDHVLGALTVGVAEAAGIGQHGMDQVKGRAAAPGGPLQGVIIQDVPPGQFHQGVIRPGPAFELGQGAPQGPDPVAGAEEFWHQAPPHVAGGAGD